MAQVMIRVCMLLTLPLAALLLGGCVTVHPAQRAVLADPVMQFRSDPGEQAQLQEALEDREGAYGGGSVHGGGCGCN